MQSSLYSAESVSQPVVPVEVIQMTKARALQNEPKFQGKYKINFHFYNPSSTYCVTTLLLYKE